MFRGFFISDPMYMFTLKSDPKHELHIKIFNNSKNEATEALINITNILRHNTTEDLIIAFADSGEISLVVADMNKSDSTPTLTKKFIQLVQSIIKEISEHNITTAFTTNDLSKFHTNLTMTYPPGTMSLSLLDENNTLIDFYFNANNIKPENFTKYLEKRRKDFNAVDINTLPVKLKYEYLKQLDPSIVNFIFPIEYRCPITLDLMINPAKLALTPEHTINYEHNQIVMWVTKNKTHPGNRRKVSVSDIQIDTECSQKIEMYLDNLIKAKEALNSSEAQINTQSKSGNEAPKP